jgi:hypothetical protein
MNVEADCLQGAGQSKARELVQEMLEYGEDARLALRVLCLDCLLKGQLLTHNVKESLILRDFYFNYGFPAYLLLMRLKEADLLGSDAKWGNAIKSYHCFAQDWKQTGDQVAANYEGYAPLSVRYVERAVSGDFASVQKGVSDSLKQQCYYDGAEGEKHGEVLVCYIGGCTHGEVNSIRRLNGNEKVRYWVLTTNMVSSSDFFDHLANGIPGWDPLVLRDFDGP